MGLLPLEFTDCLQDSPYFRDSLHSHEKELERTSNNIKELVKEVKNLLQAAKSKSSFNELPAIDSLFYPAADENSLLFTKMNCEFGQLLNLGYF